MRIGTYNVYGLRGYPAEVAAQQLGGPLDERAAAHFARVFNALGCDALALQEGVAHSQMQRIAALQGCGLATLPSPLDWPGHLLSRYDIVESRVFSHYAPDAEARPLTRAAGAVLLDVGPGARLWVVVVHLFPGVGHAARRLQESRIIDAHVGVLLGDTPYVVVLGDFNAEVDEGCHDWLRARGFVNAVQRATGALIPTKGARAVDHIYLSPALAPGLRAAAVVAGAGFVAPTDADARAWAHSDHLPVVVSLDWP